MKRFNLLILLAVLTSSIGISSCGKSRSGPWAVKIDNDGVTVSEFEGYYYSFLKVPLAQVKMDITKEDIDNFASSPAMQRQLPLLNKRIFLEQLVGLKIMNDLAEKDSSLNKAELEALIEYNRLQTIALFYSKHKFKDKIQVTDKEIEKIYYDKRFGFSKLPLQEAEIRIKATLQQQKLMKQQNDLIRDLVQKSKVDKSGFDEYLKSKEAARAKKAEKESKKAESAKKETKK